MTLASREMSSGVSKGTLATPTDRDLSRWWMPRREVGWSRKTKWGRGAATPGPRHRRTRLRRGAQASALAPSPIAVVPAPRTEGDRDVEST
jgi:hypothetical protein